MSHKNAQQQRQQQDDQAPDFFIFETNDSVNEEMQGRISEEMWQKLATEIENGTKQIFVERVQTIRRSLIMQDQFCPHFCSQETKKLFGN